MFNALLTVTYVDFGNGVFIAGSGVIIYVPIGLSYYGLKGFNFGPGINTGHKDGTIIIPYGGLKLGKRF